MRKRFWILFEGMRRNLKRFVMEFIQPNTALKGKLVRQSIAVDNSAWALAIANYPFFFRAWNVGVTGQRTTSFSLFHRITITLQRISYRYVSGVWPNELDFYFPTLDNYRRHNCFLTWLVKWPENTKLWPIFRNKGRVLCRVSSENAAIVV